MPSFAKDGQAFILMMNDKKVRVISPEKRVKEVSLIVKNKTTIKIVAKISQGSNHVKFISILPLKSKSFFIENIKINDKIFFTPLSPPFQSIELKFGNNTYEIPPKQK